jgi:hypothetical protein
LNDAWWQTGGGVYANTYFDRMCELLYYFRSVGIPKQIFLIYPDTSSPTLLFPITDLATNFVKNPTEYLFQVSEWTHLLTAPSKPTIETFASTVERVDKDGGHFAVNEFLEYIDVPDNMEPFSFREFSLSLAGLKEQESLSVWKHASADTTPFYMVVYSIQVPDKACVDVFHTHMSSWLEEQSDKPRTNTFRLERISEMVQDIQDRKYHTISVMSVQRIGTQLPRRKSRREPKGKQRTYT